MLGLSYVDRLRCRGQVAKGSRSQPCSRLRKVQIVPRADVRNLLLNYIALF